MKPGVGHKRRVALAGAGYIADWHAKCLASVADVELVAVCDRALSRAQALAAKFGIPKTYGAIQEMLEAEAMLREESSTRCTFCCLPTSILVRQRPPSKPA